MEMKWIVQNFFVIPKTASFKINSFNYHSSNLNLQHSEKNNPLFSMRANLHLWPVVNMTELKKHSIFQEIVTEVDDDNIGYMKHPMTWSTIVLVTILVITVITAVVYEKVRATNIPDEI